MHKFYDHNLGSYMPSFYYMKLNLPFYNSFGFLFNLSKKNLSTFIDVCFHNLLVLICFLRIKS